MQFFISITYFSYFPFSVLRIIIILTHINSAHKKPLKQQIFIFNLSALEVSYHITNAAMPASTAEITAMPTVPPIHFLRLSSLLI